MDKRNGKRHNLFTEMATSQVGGIWCLSFSGVLIVPQVWQHLLSGCGGKGAVRSETGPDTSVFLPLQALGSMRMHKLYVLALWMFCACSEQLKYFQMSVRENRYGFSIYCVLGIALSLSSAFTMLALKHYDKLTSCNLGLSPHLHYHLLGAHCFPKMRAPK